MTGMNRLIVVRCPHLLEEDEGGAVLRSFLRVIEATEAYCPWVTVIGWGICSLPARGPARYFGGEEKLALSLTEAASAVTPVKVGVADGLFAALLAARAQCIVPPGTTPEFLAPFPLAVLDRPELTELLDRLGLRTLGDFAALPESHVLGRFGADGVACHRVAGGRSGELTGLRQPTAARRIDERRRRPAEETAFVGTASADMTVSVEETASVNTVGEPQFWGGASEADTRAARALGVVADLLGPDGVVTARLQGGRGPAQRARFVTWNAGPSAEGADLGAPWPGRIPPPAPVVVHPSPLSAELADDDGRAVSVSGRGLLTAHPRRLSVEKGPWSAVTAWAGPWPSDERWWSRTRRRSARLQAVAGADAHLLLAERGRWWVEATYG
jgi:protein ImuB